MKPSPLILLLLLAALPCPAQQPAPAPPLSALSPPIPPAATVPETPAPAEDENPIEVQLIPGSLNVGEQGTLTIRIPNGRRLQNPPTAIEVPGMNIQFTGTSSQGLEINGRVIYRMELNYLVEGLEAGDYTIPAQTFIIDGKKHTTKAIKVSVAEGPPIAQALQPQAQLTVGKTEMWEGEEVPVTVSVIMHPGLRIVSQPLPVIKTEGIAVSRFDRQGRMYDQTEINGQLWNSWVLPSSMVAVKTGAFSLGPAEVKLEADVPVEGGGRDPFGQFSISRRTLKVKTNSIPIRVKPLPAEGKPAGFNGVVGKFQIMAQSDTPSGGPQPVQLGDPVGFEIRVTGMGNLDAIPAPGLEHPDGLRAYKPKVSGESRGLGVEQGQKVFTQILFAEKPGPISVVFTLPYFDPQAGKYAVVKSQAIELIVTGNPEAVAAANTAATAESRDFSGIPEAVPPGEQLTEILPHPLDASRWHSLTAITVPVHPWLLHGAPAVLLALILGTGTARRLRAWAIARRPPRYAPRCCADIARDMHRSRLSRLQFYGFVSEYAGAWEYWKKSVLPEDHDLAELLAARDRWLYAANADAAAIPVPADEQSRAASLLTSRLSA